MKNLYILTLEKIEQRYTTQWYVFWKKEFSKYFNVIYIDGQHTSDIIEKGRFLDINKTNLWKAQQIQIVSRLFMKNEIKNGDSFLFMDSWHFGIVPIKYMAQLSDIKIKMFGYWHAGTYDPYDFISQKGLQYWANESEISWFKALDGSFVATNFHKELILKKYKGKINSRKIYVVGFPMDWIKEIQNKLDWPYNKQQSFFKRKNIILFPHRLDKEKQPEIFDWLSTKFPYEFIKTLEVTRNKKEYYSLLEKSKIVFSASKQETFGIGIVEGLMLGCVPIVPNKLSYKELYDGVFRYSNYNVARQKIKYFIEHYDSPSVKTFIRQNKEIIINNSLNAIPKMAKIIRGKVNG